MGVHIRMVRRRWFRRGHVAMGVRLAGGRNLDQSAFHVAGPGMRREAAGRN